MKVSRRSFVGSIAALIGLGSVCDINAFQNKLPAAPSVGKEFTLMTDSKGRKFSRVVISDRYIKEKRSDIIGASLGIICNHAELNDNQYMRLVGHNPAGQIGKIKLRGLDTKYRIKEHIFTIYKNCFEYNIRLMPATAKIYPISFCKLGE